MIDAAYDGATGTAGGPVFAGGLAALAREKSLDVAALAAASGVDSALLDRVLAGEARIAVGVLAALARALRVKAIEFMQKTELLSLAVYAGGLDPLFFLPAGPIRFDARIYMREINPRHAVPEGDMTKRNASLRALAEDPLLSPQGRLELEMCYLLRAAVEQCGGAL